jgi:hypothetical protein
MSISFLYFGCFTIVVCGGGIYGSLQKFVALFFGQVVQRPSQIAPQDTQSLHIRHSPKNLLTHAVDTLALLVICQPACPIKGIVSQ